MKTINKIFLALALSFAVIAAMKAQTPDIDPMAPVLTLEKDTIQYGTITYDADGWRIMRVKNTGKSPLIIQNVYGECGCTTAKDGETKTWTQEPIAPGKSGIIKIHYDTKRQGPFVKHVNVESNAVDKKMQFVIKGEILPQGVQPPKTKRPVGPVKSVKVKPQPISKPKAQ